MLLVLAFTSDGLRIRFPFVCLGFAFTFIGFIIYASISDVHAQIRVAYFATFMMCWGTSAPSVLLSAVSLIPREVIRSELSSKSSRTWLECCAPIFRYLTFLLVV